MDYNLIYLLSENARVSLKNLSKNLRKTSQRLKYSTDVLYKEDILTNPYCIFDYSYFGLILFRIYFRGGYVGESDKEKIVRELSDNPYIVSIYELAGEFDISAEIASPNPSKFNKELKKLVTQLPTLKDYKVILNLVTHICPRHYLTKNESLQSLNVERVVGGDRERESFSSNEMSTIKALVLNPKARLTEFASITNLNIKTVRTMLDDLTKRGIIKGFKYTLNTNKLSINKYRLFIKLHNLSQESESQITAYLLKTKEIVQINKTVGDWDIEVDIESLDKSRIRYFVISLREKFKEVIERFNIIEFYKYYKRSYLPLFLFNEEKNT